MNILIVKMSAIGDVIHTLPALNTLRRHFPDAHIAWLVEEAAAPLVVGHEALDRVLVSKRKSWITGLKTGRFKNAMAACRFIGELRDTEYDMILDFQSLLKSGVLIAVSRGKRKIGFDRGMEHMERSYLFLNERIAPVDMEHHALLRNLMLLDGIGIRSHEIEYRLPIGEGPRVISGALLDSLGTRTKGPLVAIHPMAQWATKLWDWGRFAWLADRLVQEYDATVVFTGSGQDRSAIDAVIAGMSAGAGNLAGKTDLKTLAALYEKADCVVSTDTGPMHLAAAVGTPVVALFGPTAPWRTGPFGAFHQVVRADGLSCSPCFKRKCETRACMDKISVEDVLDAVQRLGLLGKPLQRERRSDTI